MQTTPTVEADGLRVAALGAVRVASLRYFDCGGRFGGLLTQVLGQPLPQPLKAVRAAAGQSGETLLAWRSPTETLLLCSSAAAFAALEQQLAGAVDGIMVEQTGGICVFRVQGRRSIDLLQRLGAATAIPDLGEARSGRLADLQVLTACVQAEEYVLFVERVYAAHLVEWLRATAADFAQPPA